KVYVQACIFPVRYDDFDAGVVEKVLDRVGAFDLLITSSQAIQYHYDLDRFACKRRDGAADSDNQTRTKGSVGTGLQAGAEYIQSALPYQGVATHPLFFLDGPDAPAPTPPPVDPDPTQGLLDAVYLNQYFLTAAGRTHATGNPGTPDVCVEIPFDPDTPEDPPTTELGESGSGGAFLSNEVFYRGVFYRTQRQRPKAAGHLHLPLLRDTEPSPARTRFLSGATLLVLALARETPGAPLVVDKATQRAAR